MMSYVTKNYQIVLCCHTELDCGLYGLEYRDSCQVIKQSNASNWYYIIFKK